MFYIKTFFFLIYTSSHLYVYLYVCRSVIVVCQLEKTMERLTNNNERETYLLKQYSNSREKENINKFIYIYICICRFSQFRKNENVCLYIILVFLIPELCYSFPIFLSFRFIDVFIFSPVCPLL